MSWFDSLYGKKWRREGDWVEIGTEAYNRIIKSNKKKEIESARIAAINSFIPVAIQEAIKRAEEPGLCGAKEVGYIGRAHTHCFKTQFFHEIMNRMTREAGLRV